ncbi:MAG: type III-A CRISPR-associated protein Cas10/Csm1 [Sphingomonadales bacterium]|nr:MAG: type III-A CRISPR-associated protein Cas10/Csm1 [Sphingomonadales bacterium]
MPAAKRRSTTLSGNNVVPLARYGFRRSVYVMPADASLESWMNATCRVALSAMLHDLGKLTQRAGIHDERSDAWAAHQTLYCPFVEAGGYHTHQHAAATAMAFDALERFLPPVLEGDVAPFVARGQEAARKDITDSLVNAAAAHHKPQTGLQWCIAAADRIASGFERDAFEDYNGRRDDHLTARLLVPFEEIERAERVRNPDELAWRYPLAPLSVKALFPERVTPGDRAARTQDYDALWHHLLKGAEQIPGTHRQSWPLWLDAFDELWLSATHCIPSATAFGTRPDVSLYDHSRTTAALAAAIWRYHAERGDDFADVARAQKTRSDWESAKFLLIQGDFAGIQAFIFGGASETQKGAAKLLRGRSAFVSLLCELAALSILDALGLPPTSQVINAAGKFLIVAPNTPAVREAIDTVRAEFDAWFLDHSFGLASIVIATQPASPNDFIGQRFAGLHRQLGLSLERAKRQRFGFGSASAPDPIRPAAYPNGPCRYDPRLPAETEFNGQLCARLSRDQLHLGGWLARTPSPVLIILAAGTPPRSTDDILSTAVFGYRIVLGNATSERADASRAFDLSLPGVDDTKALFKGLSRRAINAYVPLLSHKADADARYDAIAEPAEAGDLKTFEHLAHDAQQIDADGRLRGVAALGLLKGDIDNLGSLFASALSDRPTFASLAGLSRRVTSFFSVIVPHYCASRFSDTYTVFAGGDDFFFIGPWRGMKPFALALREQFGHYCAENPRIHFSAAYLMAKPGHPLRTLTSRLEATLDAAKARPGKNAIGIAAGAYSSSLGWSEMVALQKQADKLAKLVEDARLSGGFLYDVLSFCNMAQSLEAAGNGGVADVTAARWRALLTYRTRRHLRDHRLPDLQARVMQALAIDGIDRFRGDFRHALSDFIYMERN